MPSNAKLFSTLLVVTFLSLTRFTSTAYSEAPYRNAVISEIKINATDIFDLDTKPYLNKIPYSWINFLHIKTRTHVIAQELLFKVGEKVNVSLFEETERNLRALPFISAARVAIIPKRDGTVLVVVYTNDSWTTEPQLNINGIDDIDEIEVGFKEKNFLGYGKQISMFYRTDSDNSFNETSYKYTDRRLFNSWWKFQGEYIDKSEGQEKIVSLDRPFFSLETPYSLGVRHSLNDEVIEEFGKNNVAISEFDQTKEITEVLGGVKLGGGRRIVNRAGLRYRNENQRFERNSKTNSARSIPKNEDLQTIFFDFSTFRSKFIKITQVEKMTRIEDINLGPDIGVSPGYSPADLTGRQNSSSLIVNYNQGFLFFGEHLLQGRLSHESRQTFENPANQKYTFDTRYYHRLSRMQTIVIHPRIELGRNLDSDNQVTLGNSDGLRAFEDESIVGVKSLLLNVEDRLFVINDLWNLVTVGGVAYYDTGYSWPKGQPVALSDMLNAVGMGFRFGLTKSSNELIVRIDFSYRLNKLNSNDGDFVVTFGSGQAF